MLDQSLGKGGIIFVQIPDDNIQQKSSLYQGLQFLSNQSKVNWQQFSIGGPQVLNCSIVNSKLLKIFLSNSVFVLAGQTVAVSIQNSCINPSSLWWLQQSLNIYTTTYDGLTQVEQSSQSIFINQLTPQIIQSTSLLYGSQVIGLQSQTLTIKFQTISPIPQNGLINIVFPFRFQGTDLSGSSQNLLYINQNFTIQSLTINGIDRLVQYQYQIIKNTQQILQLNCSTINVQAISFFQIVLTQFNNPLQFQQTHGISIQTFDNLNSLMDQSAVIPLIVQAPAIFQNINASINSGFNSINQISSILISLQSPTPLPNGCIIQINIPLSLTQNIQQNLNYVYVSGLFGVSQQAQFSFGNINSDGSQTIMINNACKTTIINDQNGQIKLKYIQNPNSVRNTEPFSIFIYDQSNNMISQTQVYQGFNSINNLILQQNMFSAGNLAYSQISGQNKTVGEQNNLIVSIQVSNNLGLQQNPLINISIPVIFQLQNQCQFSGMSYQLNQNSVQCSVDQVNRVITISNFLAQSVNSSSGIITFQISNFIVNPITQSLQIGSFLIQTIANNYVVDQQYLQNPFQITAGVLFNANLSFYQSITQYQNPTIQLSFTNQHILLAGSFVQFNLQTQDLQLYSSNQTSQIISANSLICMSQQKINVSSCNASIGTNGQINVQFQLISSFPKMSLFNVTFQNIFNKTQRYQGNLNSPISLQTIISGQIIDQSSIYPYIQDAQLFKNSILNLGSLINSAQSSLIIQLNFSIGMYSSDEIRISLSGDAQSLISQYKNQISCSSNSQYQCAYISQNKINTNDYIRIRGIMQGDSYLLAQVQGFINANTTKPISQFIIQAYDVQGRLIQDFIESFKVQTTQAETINYISLIQSQTQANIETNYTITIGKVYNSQNGDILPWVKLTLPDCIGFASNQPFQIQNQVNNNYLTIQKYSQFDYVFQLSNGLNILSLQNLINPTQQSLISSLRLSFQYRTYADQSFNYGIEQQLSGLEPSVACISPCATCSISNKQFCYSCQDQLNQILLVNLGQCYQKNLKSNSTCPKGYFLQSQQNTAISNSVCQVCPTGCQNCQDQTGICQTCQSQYLLNQTSQQCIPQNNCIRSQGYININDQTCQQCSSNCMACGNLTLNPLQKLSQTWSPNYCTQCNNSSQVVSNGICMQSCPNNQITINQTGEFNQKVQVCVDQQSIQPQQAIYNYLTQNYLILMQQQNYGAILLHYPTLIIVLIPLLMFSKCQEYGRNSLSNREILFLTIQAAELISLIVLILKISIAFQHNQAQAQSIIAFDLQQQSQQLNYANNQKMIVAEQNINYIFIGIFLFTISQIVFQFIASQWFFRAFINLWDNNIVEDYHEDFKVSKKKRCCCLRSTLMRYYNFHEWISLWRVKGWIIPQQETILIDNMIWLFLKYSRYYSIYLLFIRYLGYSIILVLIQTQVSQSQIFQNQEYDSTMRGIGSQYQNYQQFFQDQQDYIFNSCIEIIILGICQTMIFQKYLFDKDIYQIMIKWQESGQYDYQFSDDDVDSKYLQDSNDQRFSKKISKQDLYTFQEEKNLENEQQNQEEKQEKKIESNQFKRKQNKSFINLEYNNKLKERNSQIFKNFFSLFKIDQTKKLNSQNEDKQGQKIKQNEKYQKETLIQQKEEQQQNEEIIKRQNESICSIINEMNIQTNKIELQNNIEQLKQVSQNIEEKIIVQEQKDQESQLFQEIDDEDNNQLHTFYIKNGESENIKLKTIIEEQNQSIPDNSIIQLNILGDSNLDQSQDIKQFEQLSQIRTNSIIVSNKDNISNNGKYSLNSSLSLKKKKRKDQLKNVIENINQKDIKVNKYEQNKSMELTQRNIDQLDPTYRIYDHSNLFIQSKDNSKELFNKQNALPKII